MILIEGSACLAHGPFVLAGWVSDGAYLHWLHKGLTQMDWVTKLMAPAVRMPFK